MCCHINGKNKGLLSLQIQVVVKFTVQYVYVHYSYVVNTDRYRTGVHFVIVKQHETVGNNK